MIKICYTLYVLRTVLQVINNSSMRINNQFMCQISEGKSDSIDSSWLIIQLESITRSCQWVLSRPIALQPVCSKSNSTNGYFTHGRSSSLLRPIAFYFDIYEPYKICSLFFGITVKIFTINELQYWRLIKKYI